MSAHDAAGSSLTFSGVTMDLMNISLSGVDRPTVETTTLATTTWRTHQTQTLAEPGTVTATVQYDHSDNLITALTSGNTQTLTITLSSGAGDTYSASAALTSINVNAPESGGLLTADLTFKLLSTVTYAT